MNNQNNALRLSARGVVLAALAVFDLGCADVAGPAASPHHTPLIDQASLPRVALDAGQSRCDERGDPLDPPDSEAVVEEAVEFRVSGNMNMMIEIVNTRTRPIRVAKPVLPAYRLALYRIGSKVPLTLDGEFMHRGLTNADSIELAPRASFERLISLKRSTIEQILPGQYRLKVEYLALSPQNVTKLKLRAWVNVIVHE